LEHVACREEESRAERQHDDHDLVESHGSPRRDRRSRPPVRTPRRYRGTARRRWPESAPRRSRRRHGPRHLDRNRAAGTRETRRVHSASSRRSPSAATRVNRGDVVRFLLAAVLVWVGAESLAHLATVERTVRDSGALDGTAVRWIAAAWSVGALVTAAAL